MISYSDFVPDFSQRRRPPFVEIAKQKCGCWIGISDEFGIRWKKKFYCDTHHKIPQSNKPKPVVTLRRR